MARSYFRLYDDVYIPGRWELGDLYNEGGIEVDGGRFNDGVSVDFDGTLRIPLCHPGTPLDFSHLVGASVPVVSRRVAEVFTSLAASDIQLIPARIESQAEKHYLVNVTHAVKCIDDTKSEEVQYWQPEDGRPDRTGQYRAVHGMRVDPERIPPDIKMLRPQGWTIVLVVSDEIHDALKRIGATGAKFKPV